MNPNKALWEKGDFSRIAESMRASGEALVNDLGISRGIKLLDLGCGDGTTALPAARLGADVLGVDIASNLVAAGNNRARARGPDQLPVPGRRRGRISRISAMAPLTSSYPSSERCSWSKPFDVAKEMVRVTRPGGRIVMGIGFLMIRHW